MKTSPSLPPPAPLSLALGLALLLLPAATRAAGPMVSNLTAAQRAGTKLVETPASPGKVGSAPVCPKQAPEGLSGPDWSGIRGAYERNRHAIIANLDGSHQARNPGQAWLTQFDGCGFTVTSDADGWSWGLELVGYGETTEVRQDGGKISYVRGDGLTEWFVNDTRGLEQGWTLAKRPERAGASGPIRLDLSVRGSLRPEISAEGANVKFLNESGGTALNYGGLKAWDANGKAVRTRFEAGDAGSSGLCVTVDDTGATYPITVDPIAQQAYLKASNTGAGDDFGCAVAVSGDTVVVGAQGEASNATGVNGNQADNSAAESGAAYVFVRNGTTWSQQAYLKASNTGAGDYFGNSVAISGDTVVVGAVCEDSSSSGVNGFQTSDAAIESGAAYVFMRSGNTWNQQAYLKASNTGAGDYFGASVAISGDTVVVGAVFEDSDAIGVNGSQAENAAVDSGAAYVFARSGGSWSQQAYLKASNTGGGDDFGTSVAVSGDTVVVGALSESSGATGVNDNQADNSAGASGAAYVFMRSGTTWSQQAYLKASNTGPGDHFGWSVALSGDSLVVGAPFEYSSATGVNGNQADNSAGYSGAAYVFVRSGTAWSQQAYLKASNTGASDAFGLSVGMSCNTVVVGAPYEDSNATGVDGNQTDNSFSQSGAAYVFVRIGSTWSQQAYLKASNARNTGFGQAVAISNDTAIIGAPDEGSYAFEGIGRYMLWASSAHGLITGSGDYAVGTLAALRVTANPGHLFAGWTGDASGTANPLSVLMDTDKTITATFTPDTNDNDGDGLTNYQEIVVYGTDPTKPDTDGDGVNDKKDAFPLDPAETLDTDGDGVGDNADPDDDNDGYSDLDEISIYHTNPKRADSDGDGLTDPQEIETYHTDPNLADTDSDGLNDGPEVLTYHTNPLVGDTDGDGFLDGYEIVTGKLPLDPLDKPALVAEARTAIEFTFPAALGKIYRIEASTDLVAWEIVESGIAGTGGQIQRFYSTRGTPKRYLRVEEVATP